MFEFMYIQYIPLFVGSTKPYNYIEGVALNIKLKSFTKLRKKCYLRSHSNSKILPIHKKKSWIHSIINYDV
jgi:hypothetical protein